MKLKKNIFENSLSFYIQQLTAMDYNIGGTARHCVIFQSFINWWILKLKFWKFANALHKINISEFHCSYIHKRVAFLE